ncbi:MAG: hypothetical protein AAF432_04245 [Planctomycetota bacterium]
MQCPLGRLVLVLAILLSLSACAGSNTGQDASVDAASGALGATTITPPPAIAPNPLAGTVWRVESIVGEQTLDRATAVLSFGDDGTMTTTVVQPNGVTTTEYERYVVERDVISMFNDMGYDRQATFELYGDEMRIDTTAVSARLRLITGSVQEEIDAPLRRGAVGTYVIDHPLAGTSWKARRILGDARYFQDVWFEFERVGRLTIRILRTDGTMNVIHRQLRYDGQTILLTDQLGHELRVNYQEIDDELILDFTRVRVILLPTSG